MNQLGLRARKVLEIDHPYPSHHAAFPSHHPPRTQAHPHAHARAHQKRTERTPPKLPRSRSRWGWASPYLPQLLLLLRSIAFWEPLPASVPLCARRPLPKSLKSRSSLGFTT